jgi:hypothetical protein
MALVGNRVERPQQLAVLGVERLEEAAHAVLAAVGADQHLALDDGGRHRFRVALFRIGDLRLPQQLAGLRVERDELGVERAHEQPVALDRDAPVVRTAAKRRDRTHLVLVVPVFLAGRRVDRVHVVERRRQEHHAVDDDRRGLHRLQHRRLEDERRLELAHVPGVDLVAGVVARLRITPVRVDPVLRVGRRGIEHRLRDLWQRSRHRLRRRRRAGPRFLRMDAERQRKPGGCRNHACHSLAIDHCASSRGTRRNLRSDAWWRVAIAVIVRFASTCNLRLFVRCGSACDAPGDARVPSGSRSLPAVSPRRSAAAAAAPQHRFRRAFRCLDGDRGGCANRSPDDAFATNARLLASVRNDDASGIERALRDGAAVNSRNRLGESALLIALKKNRGDFAQTLLAAGADVNEAAVNGVTPLMAAAYAGNADMTRALLARGADPLPVDRIGKNAMTYAAGEGHAEIVSLLLAKGVDPNAVYRNDLTALMWAAGYGHAATVRVLIDAGARVDLRDNRGKSALDMAREFNHAEAAALLESARGSTAK